jgi:cell division protein FtsZ
MSIRLQLPKVTDLKPRITVVGVGGAGGNAVNNMIAAGLQGVDFVVANTDAQALAASSAEHRIQLGTNLTEGMGAGSKPEIGEAAAEEAIDDIRAQVAGSHMLFIAAGMGGGTGTGAAAVIARAARELGVLTVAVVTKPFQFEGARRLRIAEAGIIELKDTVDTLIVIPNQNLFRISNERTTFAEAFVLADQVLYSGIACIVDLIVKEGLINLDLADVRTVLTGMGSAMMGTGEASGEDRARMAAEEAIHNPLLDDVSLRGARGLLVSIIGGHDLTLHEVDAAANRVREEVDPEANIIVGATFDETLGDRVRVSIVASGMARDRQNQRSAPASAPLFRQPTSHSATSEFSSGRTPPPLPSMGGTSHPQAGAHTGPGELERRLAGAVEPGSGYGNQFDGPLAASARRDGLLASRPAEHARRPGDVTIDERAPQYLDHIAASRPNGSSSNPESGYDATHERKDRQLPPGRGSQRVPDISDFPPIAQHEYRVRVEGAPAPQSALTVAGHQPHDPQAQKKPGLFQRITGAGRVRKANAADTSGQPSTEAKLPGFLTR